MPSTHTVRPSLTTSARRTAARWIDAYLTRGFSAHVVIGPHR